MIRTRDDAPAPSSRDQVRPTPVDRHSDSPAYLQVLAGIRELALSIPWDDTPALPAEPQLMELFNVSRGTLRRATAELTRDGLLVAERGRGTFVSRDQQVRWVMNEHLHAIALPDSRWHTDVTRFVPDFAGSDAAIQRIESLPAFRDARTVFITPDNSLHRLTVAALTAGRTVVMPTYGLRRGMVVLDPARLEPAERAFAATLDGLERLGSPLEFDDLRTIRIDCVVTGATAVSLEGRHFGSAEGFFATEWRLLSVAGSVESETPILCVVHDVQVMTMKNQWTADSVSVDVIATPTRLIEPTGQNHRPTGIDPRTITPRDVENIPYLAELLRSHGRGA
jgi:5-formyltetrahydrofolate cyclo-ligase